MKNNSLLSRLSQILTGKFATAAASFLTFVILARVLNVEELGAYIFFTSVCSIVSMVANWGTNELLFRKCSTDPSCSQAFLRIARTLKFTLAAFLTTLFSLYLWAQEWSQIEIIAAVFLLTASIADAQSMTYIVLRRAAFDNRTEAVFFPVRALFKLALIAGVAMMNGDLLWIAMSVAIINISAMAILWRRYVKLFAGAMIVAECQDITFCQVMRAATPYAVFSVIGAFYTQNGVIFATMLGSKEIAAIYGVGLQFYQAMILLPVAFNIAVQPTLSRAYEQDKGKWSAQISRLYKNNLILSVVIGTLLVMALPVVLNFAFDDRYKDASTVIEILMVALIFRFMSSALIGSAMISANKVASYNKVLLASLCVNITLNILLIPDFKEVGAALSLLAGEFATFTAGSIILMRHRRSVMSRHIS